MQIRTIIAMRRLRCNQNGSSTVEFVLWPLLFAFLLMLTAVNQFTVMFEDRFSPMPG